MGNESVDRMIQPGIRRWEVLYELMNQHNYRKIAEVGCKEGRTTEYILSAFPDSTVVAVDPFENVPNDGESYDEWDFNAIEEDFWRRCEEFAPRARQLKMLSVDASKEIEDGSLDLVFIDAAHDYDNVMADIEAWYPKVKHGGLLTGHDFKHTFVGVMRAVADNFNLMHVQTFPDSVWAVAV